MALRSDIAEGKFSTVQALHERFLALPPNSASARLLPKVHEVDQDAGSSEEEEDDDQVMSDAPVPVPQGERLERVIDEDGFELVQKGRRR